MANLDDIIAASKILSEDPESVIGCSGSKPNVNRDRVSYVGKDDGISAADDDVVIERDMESEAVVESNFDGKSASDCCLDDQEKEEIGVEVSGEVLHVDGDGGIGEESKDPVNEFYVGDLVWGKIRSHPWWPGQIYNPKDASEFFMKRKQEGRLLVAFFGDGSCSWCLPSQLIPFVENFSEMSTVSSSKSFLSAVQRAVDEVGRIVELEMTCSCVSEEKKDCLARPAVENAGLKAGVVMPEVDVYRLPIPKYEPLELLEKSMQLAKGVSVGNALEVAVLRSWLSAFYYYKGGSLLPMYHEPLHIEGLEDKNENVEEVANDFSVPNEVPAPGPHDDDWLGSPAGGSDAPSQNKVPHKRKKRSVAELMGDNENIKPESRKRTSVEDGTDFEKSASSQRRKKNNDGELGSEGAFSTGKTGRKRKVEVSESTNIRNANLLEAETGSADGGTGDPLSEKLPETQVANAENTSGKAKEAPEKVSALRERKKSKYLSPPYTNLLQRIGNSSSRLESQVEYAKTTKIALMGECQRGTTGDLFASQSIPVDNASKDKLLPNQPLERPDGTSLRAVKNDKNMSFSVSDVDVPVNELLSDIKLAALDPFYLSKEGSLDMVWAFVSALRSSTYLHGPDYEVFNKCKNDEPRKLLPSQVGNQVISFFPREKMSSPHRSTSKELKSDKKLDTLSKSKEAAAETSNAEEGKMKNADGKGLPLLYFIFCPDNPLPSKKEIVRMFGEFGRLYKKGTRAERQKHSVQVVYMEDADAEAAYRSCSYNSYPFGKHCLDGMMLFPSAEAYSRLDVLVREMNGIRNELELTRGIVEEYMEAYSPEEKSSLKNDLGKLKQTIRTIRDKAVIMATKTSSS